MSGHRPLRHTNRRSLLAVAALALLSASVAFVHSPTEAAAAEITSAGPLTTVETTPDLNCLVQHADDSSPAFYGSYACDTFVTDGTNLYGPASIPAGDGATGVSGYQPWTPVSQTGPSGSGTAADPYTIVTTVSGGPFTVIQTDSYILGQESYRTDIEVRSSSAVDATIYRAGDCYLQDDDDGLGELAPGNAPTCKALPSSANPDRIEQWYPLTPGSNHIVDSYSEVWAAVGSMQPFPDFVDESGAYDNAAGLSWSAAIAAGGTSTFSHLTLFSPVGALPVSVTKSVTPSTVAPGGTVTYTISVNNSSSRSVPISTIIDELPDGFAYIPGSTTGVTADDPSINGQELTWSGDFELPGGSVDTPGTISLTFEATASMVPGTYTNTAWAVGSQGATVIPATDVAPVTVTTSATTTSTTQPPTTLTPTTTAPPTTQPSTTLAPTPTAPPIVAVDRTDPPAADPVPATPAYTG